MDDLERARARSLRDQEAANRAYEAKMRARREALNRYVEQHLPHWAGAISRLSELGYGPIVEFQRDVVSKYFLFGPLMSVWRGRDGENIPVRLESFLPDPFKHPDGERWGLDDHRSYAQRVSDKLGAPFRITMSPHLHDTVQHITIHLR